MKIVFSDQDKTVYQRCCPDCDRPLHVRHFHGSGYWLDWLDWETPVSRCPGCGSELPELAWDSGLLEPRVAA